MRTDGEDRRVPLPDRSKGAQRRRRLARGVARWDFDRRHSGTPGRRIARVTLTVTQDEPEVAIGWVYKFLAKVRRDFLGSRYFCFLELQRRGAVHYHMIWLDPPSLKRVDLIAWVDRAWGHGRTQVRFTSNRLSIEDAVGYAVAHSKKMGKKRHQQEYDQVPRQLRTFMSQRLDIPPAEIDGHLDQEVWAYRSAGVQQLADRPGHTKLIGAQLVYVGELKHIIPPGGRCTALDRRRQR